MTIQSERLVQTALEMSIEGRLDTATAPQLERKIKQWGDEITELILNFEKLTYISSMGLRVLLQTQKDMHARGHKLVITNMNAAVREVFEMTGFIKLLVQEERFVVIRKEGGQGLTLCLIGRMDEENVGVLTRELAAIKAADAAQAEPLPLVLDTEQLRFISTPAAQLLRKTIAETSWEKRTLRIINVSLEALPVFTSAGMGSLVEG